MSTGSNGPSGVGADRAGGRERVIPAVAAMDNELGSDSSTSGCRSVGGSLCEVYADSPGVGSHINIVGVHRIEVPTCRTVWVWSNRPCPVRVARHHEDARYHLSRGIRLKPIPPTYCCHAIRAGGDVSGATGVGSEVWVVWPATIMLLKAFLPSAPFSPGSPFGPGMDGLQEYRRSSRVPRHRTMEGAGFRPPPSMSAQSGACPASAIEAQMTQTRPETVPECDVETVASHPLAPCSPLGSWM